MTVKQLIEDLELLLATKQVAADTPIIWQSMTHTWDIEPKVTTRSGKTVILVNP